MITKYRIEMWDPLSKQYVLGWHGNDLERAEIMMSKSYNSRMTRKLIKTTEEVLYTIKAKK